MHSKCTPHYAHEYASCGQQAKGNFYLSGPYTTQLIGKPGWPNLSTYAYRAYTARQGLTI